MKLGHDTLVALTPSVMRGVAVAGDVCLGEAALVGASFAEAQGVRIGNRAIVSAGGAATTSMLDSRISVGGPESLVERGAGSDCPR